MIRTIINMGEVLDTVVGINVDFLPEGKKDISYCVLKKSKDIISVILSHSGISDFNQLGEDVRILIDKNVRIHVNLAGTTVLTRKFSQTGNSPEADFSTQFPGLRPDEFIFSSFPGKSELLCSLIRKEDVQRENLFLDDSIHSLTLGYMVLQAVQSLLPTDSVTLSGNKIFFSTDGLPDVKPSDNADDEDINLPGQVISAKCLLAYAGALSVFSEKTSIETFGLPETVKQAPGIFHAQSRLFVLGRTVLLSVFLLLMVNAAIFFWLDKRVSEAEADLVMFQGKFKKDKEENKRNSALTLAYDHLGWKLNRLPLFYTDQLAASVPDQIQLRVIETGTLNENTLRQTRKVSFDSRQIHVEGITDGPVALSEWINSLHDYPWVVQVTSQQYQHDEKIKKGIFSFKIIVDDQY